ncbi:hypothetical protein ACS5PN_23840 [Roseateles sp. NT4]|uniref:hypothetical protein n=1 Tax=Roseateles sp. NT4 TaxID=3453715 RepID=UPI003EE93EDB
MSARFSAWQRLMARWGQPLDRQLIKDAWSDHNLAGIGAGDSTAELHRRLAQMQQLPAQPALVKGAPDLNRLRSTVAGRLASASVESLHRDPAAMADARLLAQLKVEDPLSFAVHHEVFERQNAAVLAPLRAQLGAQVVLHMTCVPRLDRARHSEQSFKAKDSGLGHLHVIGGGHDSPYALNDNVLTVPVPDSYEHLPQKMAAAFALLAHVRSLEAVLKVDDDHRLADLAALNAGWRQVRGESAGQAGSVIRARHHGDHERAWHFGKCSRPELNARPHQWFAALRWCDGAAGYMVSRAGLRALHWASLYFADFVASALYEDVLMSEVMRRFSAGLRPLDMSRILAAKSDY